MHPPDALGNPGRRNILRCLRTSPTTAGELAGRFPVSRPAISRHFRVLLENGLVVSNRDGSRNLPSVRLEGFATVRLEGFASVRLEGFASVRLEGFATVRLEGFASVRLEGFATVRLVGLATVRLEGSATVRLVGLASVRTFLDQFWDSALARLQRLSRA